MKIRAAICTADTEYSERITSYCRKHYYDKFSWSVFSDVSWLSSFLEQQTADVILIDREMAGWVSSLPVGTKGKAVWLILTEDEETLPEGFFGLQKYISVDRLYRELLGAYAKKENIRLPGAAGGSAKAAVYAFVSASGGAGASTLAAAAAKYFARLGKTLYLNLENTGVVEPAFEGEKRPGMDELIYTLKSRRKALDLTLESAVSRDKSGVYFFELCENPMDFILLTGDDIKELITAAGRTGAYEKVILDIGNGVGEKEIAAMSRAERIVVVLEEDEVSRGKFARYLKALQTIETMKKADICSKMLLAFNKTFRQSRLPEEVFQVRAAGGFPKIENGTYEGIIDRLSSLEVISNLQ